MSPDDLIRVGALVEIRRCDDALDLLERVLAADPADGDAWAWRAAALVTGRRFDDALVAADRAAGLRPDDAWVHRLRAMSLRGLRRRGAALEAAERAVALAPGDDAALLELALSQRAARRHSDATQTAERVVALAPDSAEAWVVLGETRLRHDRVGAAEAFRKALAIDPINVAATNGLGSVHRAVGNREQAATLFTAAARLSPDDPVPRFHLERIMVAGGMFVFTMAGIQVLRNQPLPTALAVLAILAALMIPVYEVIRRRRLATLPPDAQDYLRDRRRQQLRTLRSPRAWVAAVRSDPRRAAVLGGAAVVFGVLAFVLPGDRSQPRRPNRLDDIDWERLSTLLPPNNELLPPVIVIACADGSTIPVVTDEIPRCGE